MKKILFLVLLIVGVSSAVQAQAPCSQGTKFRNCKACGSATSAKGQKLNVLKNRGDAPTDPQEVTVAEIRDPANNTGHFDPAQQVRVTGYVASLDKGGFKESCNCGRTDLRDIHINIVAKASERNNKTKFVVVEITPRWQEKLNLDDSDYNAMLQEVKTQILHKFVRFEGFMMSDSFHITESKNTAAAGTPRCKDDGHDPKPCVWRATTWEVHPVTAYTVVPAP
jgi:hypothetical protein